MREIPTLIVAKTFHMKKAIIALLLCAIPFLLHTQPASAQGKAKGHHKHEKAGKAYEKGYRQGSKRKGGGPPPWAPAHGYRAKNHVYFPDYYTFYDPRRNGYVYWNNNNWTFSPSVPSFMANIDLGKARIQLLGDIPLTSLPEPNFSRYYRMYPPSGSVNIRIPHPPLPR